MIGVALVAPVAQILPLLVACLSILAGAAEVPATSHAILIGVAEQFKPETVYMSCSLVGPVASYSFSRGFPRTETQIWLLKK